MSGASRALTERATLWLLCLCCALAARAAEPNPDPRTLLERMDEAVRSLDYEGRFVVQSGDRLTALHLVHRVEGGAEREHVISLNGSPREIIRNGDAVACRVEGQKSPINVARRAQGRSVSPLRGVSGEQLQAHYRLEMLEPGRVAGRDAHQVLISPLDDLRFGYRVFIDRDSALPLQSVMFDGQQRTVSQVMFTELRLGEAVAPIVQDPPAGPMDGARATDYVLSEARLSPPSWRFAELPDGFRLNAHRRIPGAHGQGAREHFIFSDGLATVSVYIQPRAKDASLSGLSRLGAARAVGREFGEHEIVAIGEVPVKTLTLFAETVEAQTP
jgi:sigma-E factor negative regulatory protein RseB